jgi:Sec-independent protein translocase protein TatA
MTTAPLAFISSGELVVVVIVGILLFGGDLPKLLRDLGQMWVKLRRSVNEFKREAGIDEAVNEIRRQTDFRLEEPRWRRDMDHAAGPARQEPPVEAQIASGELPPPPADAEPPPPPAEDAPPTDSGAKPI